MKLDNFLMDLLENIISEEGINKVKNIIKDDMKVQGVEYKTTKVECQVFTEKNNYNPRVEIKSEGYKDGEIIFIDYFLD